MTALLQRLLTESLIDLFAAKAPVRRYTAQRTANAARRILEHRGVTFPPAVSTALSHALATGEGREEFDDAMTQWRSARGSSS